MESRKIGVLMGGVSNEREISLMSGEAVLNALVEEEKLDAVGIDVVDEKGIKLEQVLRKEKVEVAFITLHGSYGEDGGIQSLLEKLSIPYTGSGIVASAICFNKYAAKNLLSSNGISTPPFVLLSGEGRSSRRAQGRARLQGSVFTKHLPFGFPVVVKPCSGGSAIGISIVKNSSDLDDAFHAGFEHDDCILVEKYIPGREVTVSILGNREPQVLPIIEIIPRSEFYDYRAKYEPGMSDHILPARLSIAVKKEVEEIGIFAYGIMGCRGFARVDMIVGEDGIPYVLDINSIPGLTATSLFPEAAKAAGMKLGKLCRKLLEMVD